MKVQKKKLETYTKDEWRGIMESLDPKLDGPIVNLDEDYNGPGIALTMVLKLKT